MFDDACGRTAIGARRLSGQADGVTGYLVEGRYGLSAPAGTAPDIVNLLNASVAKAIATGVFKTIETNEGLMFAPGTPEDFGRFVIEDITRWQNVVRDANIQAQ